MDNQLSVGDAVLTFLGDTTQLDLAFDKVNSGTTAALDPANAKLTAMGDNWGSVGSSATRAGEEATVAGGEIAAAGEMSAASTRQAKAEMALLGEEIGVRIPRHLRGFVAELPGVGQALTAAFSATAVLMLLQILVTASDKLSDFLALVIYGADAAKQQMEGIKALNDELVGLSKEYTSLKQKIDDYGKSALQLAEQSKQQVEKSVKDLTAQFKEEEAEITRLDAVARDHTRTRIGLTAAYQMFSSGQMTWLQALTAVTVGETQAVLHAKEIDAAGAKLILTSRQLAVAKEKEVVATHSVTDAYKKQQEEFAKIVTQYQRVTEQLAKAEAEFKKLATVTASEVEPVMISAAAHVQQLGAALRALGNDNVDLELQAIKATKDMAVLDAAYHKNEITVRQHALAEVAELNIMKQLAIARNEDTTSIDKQILKYQQLANGIKKTEGFWDAFSNDFKKKAKDNGTAAQLMGNLIGQTVAQMDQAFASAIMGAMMSGQSIGAALQQATKAILAQLAEQALAKSLFYTAEGIAAATNPYTAAMAPGYFAAAAEFAVVAGAAGAGAMAMGGGPGSGSGGGNNTNSASNPGGAQQTHSSGGPTSVTGVQRFAAGGLITGPTLAMLGDSKSGGSATEAVLPLDDDQAMGKVRDAVGGGHTFNVHVHGLVSPDNLNKVMEQMSRRVMKGTSTLHSSNSLRYTRRSQ